jgi:translation elongation factor EF-1alpha
MGGFFTKLFGKLSGKKELKIIIIGLDNSGKTTILSNSLYNVDKLHLNEIKETVPSML